MSAPYRLLLVDDHPIIRRGWRQIFDSEPDLEVCAEASDSTEALDAVATARPDLALIDLSLQGTSGIDLTKLLRREYPDLKIVIISMYGEHLYRERSIGAGADEYLSKDRSHELLLDTVRRILKGHSPTENSDARGGSRGTAAHPVLSSLTDREFEILLLLGQGFEPRHIAERLSLSVNTIESYRQRLKSKLKLESASELSRFAIDWYRTQT